MTDPDQCIICLESLQPPPHIDAPAASSETSASSTSPPVIDVQAHIKPDPDDNNYIATLVGCNHVVHDRCIRAWAKNSNTCPICRTPFNQVSVSTEVNGLEVDSYGVQDKKQTHEFDLRQWLEENPEDEPEEPETPCPICNSAERPEVLLLCDACDAAYHTDCVGLDHVPAGSWYCMECADFFHTPSTGTSDSDVQETQPLPIHSRPPFPRTRARQRRARRQARSLEWQGAWGQIAGRIFDATDIDLDNHEDDDALETFRRSQQQREREAREYREWEQRLQIASRQGARDAFARNIPREIGERLDIAPITQETPEERRAWGALDRAREAENPGTPTNRRKRKSRSTTASPREPVVEEPERKLKRPRTRRLPLQGEPSGSASNSVAGPSGTNGVAAAASPTSPTSADVTPRPLHTTSQTNGASSPLAVTTSAPAVATATPTPSSATAQQTDRSGEVPSFLSSLLKEVEMSTPSDDENVRNFFNPRNGVDPSSPVTSPSPSSHTTPRALSLTPPPFARPSSPSTLSSYVEPVFPKANYSPTRNQGETSDSESRSRGGTSEIRQPRPRRPNLVHRSPPQSRSQNASPTRPEAKAESTAKPDISLEEKERISGIVRAALKPHWRAQELTKAQYEAINRDVSRKLYEGLRTPSSLDDSAKKACEKIASQEVARAVAELKC